MNAPSPRDPAGARDGALQRTPWWRTATGRPRTTPLDADASVDVAVVGAGFVGLTAARHLAAGGLKVAVLEADQLGAGASGLNAGFVVPNFAKADPASVRARLGDEAGDRLLAAVGQSADELFDLIRSASIACDAEQSGWLHVAHDETSAAMLQARAHAWQALGRPVSFLSERDARDRTSARHCRGALLDLSGGMLNPLGLVHGLARLAIEAGASIHEQAAVTRATRAGGLWRVDVGGRVVTARSVLLCTNAFTSGVARQLGRRIVPLPVYQIATRPLAPDEARRVAPQRNPLADTRANLFTCRLDRDNRLISGGMAMLPIAAEGRMARAIAARLARELGLRETPAAEFVWRGTAAVTTDFLPHIYALAEGLYGAIGCNGRGVAVTSVVGRALADAVVRGGATGGPVPITRSALPLGPLAPLMPSLAVAHARWKDRFLD